MRRAAPAALVAALAAALAAGLAGPARGGPPPGRPALRGVGVPLLADDPERDHGPLLADLAAQRLGLTHVALFASLYQRDAESPAPARHPLRSPSDAALARTIRQARALGLEAALVPVVRLERPAEGDGREPLRPPSWPRWFQGYGREVLHWARVAEGAGATLLVVGSELASSHGEGAAWRGLVAAARRAFSGQLTYSAPPEGCATFPAWDALDFIGVAAYDPLAPREGQGLLSQGELNQGAARARDRLRRWRAEAGLRAPLLFVEFGFASQAGCARAPRDAARQAPVDLEEQARCYRAVADAWAGAPELAGAFAYGWWGEGGEEDPGPTPRGKPALEVLRAWFSPR